MLESITCSRCGHLFYVNDDLGETVCSECLLGDCVNCGAELPGEYIGCSVRCSACFQSSVNPPETVVVTRHFALVEYLSEIGLLEKHGSVITHATPEDVKGKRVIGVLPHHLSCLASSVVEIPLDIPADLRGVELTLDQVRQFAGKPQEYRVHRFTPRESCDNTP